MAENSKIEWTKHTANLWWGCTKVHEGCDHCYAETLSNRWDFHVWGNDAPRRAIKSVWKDLERYQKLAAEAGEMHNVFVGSMMDIFEKPMPLTDNKEYVRGVNTGNIRNILFENISNGWYSNLQFLLLTKRPSNINKYIPESWKKDPPLNVMFGTSPCNQKTANTLIPQLLLVKGKRFLSVEPMIGPVSVLASFQRYLNNKSAKTFAGGIDWVIVGGESGHGKRPFNSDWARDIKKECQESGVPFFMKQIDKVLPIPEDLMIREFPSLSNITQHES